MTKDEFIYGLTACGCLWHNGQVWYEEKELIQCFIDLGLIDTEAESEE